MKENNNKNLEGFGQYSLIMCAITSENQDIPEPLGSLVVWDFLSYAGNLHSLSQLETRIAFQTGLVTRGDIVG